MITCTTRWCKEDGRYTMLGLKFRFFLLPFLKLKIAKKYKPERFLKVCESDEEARLSDVDAISSDWQSVGKDMKKIIKG